MIELFKGFEVYSLPHSVELVCIDGTTIKRGDIQNPLKLRDGWVGYGTPMRETNATHIMRVLDWDGRTNEIPDDIATDALAIQQEYIRLVHAGVGSGTTDRLAKEKWLNNYLKTKFGI